MLIVRCANGVVAWLFEPTGVDTAVARCTADAFSVLLARTADDSWVQGLQSVMTHSAALRGAIQQALYIPRSI